MSDWSLRKKEKRTKRKKEKDNVSKWSIFDFLINVTDIIIWPIRFVFWILRGIGRAIGNLFDGI
ncbi:MAG: hypothetical protein ABS934_12100 [Psychrobacillus sp.]|uniref:hypothetical protein n=1 Tax=Psychrobacillus sp. MER TA 171 TaxID=2939577 RepID=UPI00203B2E9A|nr:hypothetical protein [Psychrobacillus sp. MER TA 171]MCM3357194.1 hypothetical protein [Psychrobacillus sp. MER TA 171]